MNYKLAKKLVIKFGMDKDDDLNTPMVAIVFMIIFYTYVVINLYSGYNDANAEPKCKVQNIGQILVSPIYAIGCNLGKNRFNKRLN